MTAKQKADMYKSVHDALVDSVVKLQDFAEDSSEFVDGNPSPEQEQANYSALSLTEQVGKFAVKAKRLETADA